MNTWVEYKEYILKGETPSIRMDRCDEVMALITKRDGRPSVKAFEHYVTMAIRKG